MVQNRNKKLWGGRFNAPTDELVEEFTASIEFDRRLFQEDIDGSMAHARMLGKQGIISVNDSQRLIEGLEQIRREIMSGTFVFLTSLEDIHMNIESRLAEIIGPEIAGRLHTGRSRNDQVALDLRLYMRRRIPEIQRFLLDLILGLVDQAEKYKSVVMPGFTHLQTAQPVLFAHHLLAYVEMLRRDFSRLEDCHARLNVSPLGSGALAGSSFALDRKAVAEELGFAGLTANSLDAVSDRDGVAELLFIFSLLMLHLSRFCEELVLWSSVQFRYVTLSDGFCTGSSIMPQKKNPDVPELIRGKTGRVTGALVSLLMTLKSLPLAYNKDLQEDKEPLFDALDTVVACLRIMTPMIQQMEVHAEVMLAQAGAGFSNATEIADYLVRKGLPFRQAHEIVGRSVSFCEARGLSFTELKLSDWRSFSDLFEADIFNYLGPLDAVNAKNIYGGTAMAQVEEQILRVRGFIQSLGAR
ncbi:MAG TPA: argininosuccinate lyase [Proteobacteria bacterium]|nr:argininosuccinate lyase [Pseudomonadota bacterium]